MEKLTEEIAELEEDIDNALREVHEHQEDMDEFFKKGGTEEDRDFYVLNYELTTAENALWYLERCLEDYD